MIAAFGRIKEPRHRFAMTIQNAAIAVTKVPMAL